MPLPAMVIDPLGLPALPDGLLEAATGPLDLPPHAFTSGASYYADSCGEARLYPQPCITPPYPAMTFDPGDGLVKVFSFEVYASYICGAQGVSFEEANRRVRARLQMGEARAVELAFWGPTTGDVPGVIQQIHAAAATPILADAANVVEAVSLLEQQMVSVYGGKPMIHARPRMAAYLGSRGVLADKDHRYTHYGSRVVFGAGYLGNGPDGTAVDATSEFMVATGRVIIWRSGIWDSKEIQVLDKTTNQVGVLARRSYAIGVECGVTSVQVTRA